MSALIPFAVEKETGAIKEVGDVPRGRNCGCICPCCKAGLVARQGSENEWHFAHDHRAENRPDKKCDISFESACRLFVIDLLKSARIPVIRTPALGPKTMSGGSRTRSGTTLVNLTFVDSEEYSDVSAGIGGYVLEIFMDYPSRVTPEAPGKPDITGVLAFPVELVKRRYREVRGGPKVLAGIVAGIFAEERGGKRWLHHPAIQPEEELLVANEEMKGAGNSQACEAFGGAAWNTGVQGPLGRPWQPESEQAPRAPIKRVKRARDLKGAYRCYKCLHAWEGGEESGRVCPKCGSDKHSVYSPF